MRQFAVLFLLFLTTGTAISADNPPPPDKGGHECERDKKESQTS